MVFDSEGEPKPWSLEENKRLNQLYNIELLDIIKISKIMKRTPEVIMCQLKSLKCVGGGGIRPQPRGQQEYECDRNNYFSLKRAELRIQEGRGMGMLVEYQRMNNNGWMERIPIIDEHEINNLIHNIIDKYQSMDDVLPYMVDDTTEKNNNLQQEVNNLKKEVNELKKQMNELREIIGV
jgi:FtsZ-binding cell division protein ZapB